jgi:adenylate cyclase
VPNHPPARPCFAALAWLVAHGADYKREFGGAGSSEPVLRTGGGGRNGIGQEGDRAVWGHTLNTAARLVDVCRDSDESVVASAELLDRLVLPPDVAARSLGFIRVRGKVQAIGLCALVQAAPDTRLAALRENGHIPSTSASKTNYNCPKLCAFRSPAARH